MHEVSELSSRFVGIFSAKLSAMFVPLKTIAGEVYFQCKSFDGAWNVNSRIVGTSKGPKKISTTLLGLFQV